MGMAMKDFSTKGDPCDGNGLDLDCVNVSNLGKTAVL